MLSTGGYNDYQLYRDIIKKRAHLVSRMLKSANLTLVEERVAPEGQALLGVAAYQTVQLGSGDNTVKLRMIVFRDAKGKEWQYLTTRFDLSASVIVELYLYRWEIELFFGWIKKHLQLGHWYSYNKNGVLIQLYAGLITFLLLKLYSALTGKPEFKAMRINFVRWIGRHLFDRVAEADFSAYLQLLPVVSSQVKT